MPRLRIVPKVLPSFRLISAPVPFLRRGSVAHHGLEPDVDPFRFVSGYRELDAPIQVARDRSGLQAFTKPAAREGEHVMSPVLLVVRGLVRLGVLVGGEAADEG